MKKTFVFLLHVGFWACYFLLVFIALALYYRSNHDISRVMNALNTILLFAFIPSVGSFYSYYFLLFAKYLQKKKIFQSIFIGILISLVVAILAYILLRFFIESGRIIDMDEGGKNGRSTAPQAILVMTTIGLLSGGVALVMKGFITWYNEIKLKEILREKNHEMEMMLIKKQFDPHLLFNTINNIDSLILRDAVLASDYLNKLSDIIRFVLYETRANEILLLKEIEYLEKYIALQKIRTANETYVYFSVTGNIGDRLIAPMIFIPFIENAFKHTTNKKMENAITIKINIDDESIRLTCENKYDSKSVLQISGGLGNELIKKRLSLIYPDKHTLEVNNDNELYRVNLIIQNG
ncbi:sensor histidine kinase [Sporocytophaga myxococcoides]|uniref:sensor histidine kinase n=1 Tax=Sporocytophaga myxococcoides TaxID=153721 RepID=UPI0004920A97|nr:sensor histidine kinase [Sporocytophaga myxococcoides]